jgi:hypothetical protein
MGLDKPLAEQYPHFIAGLSRGDLALSFLTTPPVNDDIAETFSATLKLVLATIVIAFAVGVPMGVVAAANKDGTTDSLIRFFLRCAPVQIYAAAGVRTADDDPRPGICFAARERLRGGARVRLAWHSELRRAQHPASSILQ